MLHFLLFFERDGFISSLCLQNTHCNYGLAAWTDTVGIQCLLMLKDTHAAHYRHNWSEQSLRWARVRLSDCTSVWALSPPCCEEVSDPQLQSNRGVWSRSCLYLTYFIFCQASQILSLMFLTGSLSLSHLRGQKHLGFWRSSGLKLTLTCDKQTFMLNVSSECSSFSIPLVCCCFLLGTLSFHVLHIIQPLSLQLNCKRLRCLFTCKATYSLLPTLTLCFITKHIRFIKGCEGDVASVIHVTMVDGISHNMHKELQRGFSFLAMQK